MKTDKKQAQDFLARIFALEDAAIEQALARFYADAQAVRALCVGDAIAARRAGATNDSVSPAMKAAARACVVEAGRVLGELLGECVAQNDGVLHTWVLKDVAK